MLTSHHANCGAAGVIFLPIVVEALGGWSEEAVFHIAKMVQLMRQRFRLPPRDCLQMRLRNISFKD